MYVVICYDISDDKRRTKIHNILKSYGQWMQYIDSPRSKETGIRKHSSNGLLQA
ncbi:MAG: CRISPR-associated endonuclease Cas2 [Trichodesmium sp. MO_231.B1]|nr:CRISPR-associated endonuclease Cas2 [Trichodesmium sp. MO_231.B1]